MGLNRHEVMKGKAEGKTRYQGGEPKSPALCCGAAADSGVFQLGGGALSQAEAQWQLPWFGPVRGVVIITRTFNKKQRRLRPARAPTPDREIGPHQGAQPGF